MPHIAESFSLIGRGQASDYFIRPLTGHLRRTPIDSHQAAGRQGPPHSLLERRQLPSRGRHTLASCITTLPAAVTPVSHTSHVAGQHCIATAKCE